MCARVDSPSDSFTASVLYIALGGQRSRSKLVLIPETFKKISSHSYFQQKSFVFWILYSFFDCLYITPEWTWPLSTVQLHVGSKCPNLNHLKFFSQMDSEWYDAYNQCTKFFFSVNGCDWCVGGVLMEVCGRWLVDSITLCVCVCWIIIRLTVWLWKRLPLTSARKCSDTRALMLFYVISSCPVLASSAFLCLLCK